MRVALFCRSLGEDGGDHRADFLRALARELASRGHEVRAWEPHGAAENAVPEELECVRYDARGLDLDAALGGADAVLVHACSDPELVRRLGDAKARFEPLLLFVDDRARGQADHEPPPADRLVLRHYDAVLTLGAALRDRYLMRRWAARAFVLREAAPERDSAPAHACDALLAILERLQRERRAPLDDQPV